VVGVGLGDLHAVAVVVHLHIPAHRHVKLDSFHSVHIPQIELQCLQFEIHRIAGGCKNDQVRHSPEFRLEYEVEATDCCFDGGESCVEDRVVCGLVFALAESWSSTDEAGHFHLGEVNVN